MTDSWQSIKTATKNHKAVLIAVGMWVSAAVNHRDRGWICAGPDYETLPPDCQPTHWMPLPPPPTMKDEGHG